MVRGRGATCRAAACSGCGRTSIEPRVAAWPATPIRPRPHGSRARQGRSARPPGRGLMLYRHVTRLDHDLDTATAELRGQQARAEHRISDLADDLRDICVTVDRNAARELDPAKVVDEAQDAVFTIYTDQAREPPSRSSQPTMGGRGWPPTPILWRRPSEPTAASGWCRASGPGAGRWPPVRTGPTSPSSGSPATFPRSASLAHRPSGIRCWPMAPRSGCPTQ